MSSDVHSHPVIIGAGLAGLTAALSLAPMPVTVLCAGRLGEGTSSAWAQGGIAAAVGPDDSPSLHLADTLAAGDGLCDPGVASGIVGEGSDAIARLARWGAAFDAADGALRLGLEAAHGRRRIVHAQGDGTGRHVLEALIATVRRTASIRVIENATARRLLRDDEGRIAGVAASVRGRDPGGRRTALVLPTARVVIATGGLGGLFAETTNPVTSTGSGLALALAVGCPLADMEFVQFHPTAIDVGRDPMPLASEALRGEGAVLIDDIGARFMDDDPAALGRGELAPRDVVARAISRRLASGARVFLDARAALGARFAQRFPGVAALCAASGIDPATMPIPVRPAVHYAMGGILVDADGRTTQEGLWACGEAACTGLHGANRLASNSLLEATVTGARVARDIAAAAAAGAGRAAPANGAADAKDPASTATAAAIRPIMSRGFGVLRDQASMTEAASSLLALEGRGDVDQGALSVALAIAAASLARRESRGAHARSDAAERDAVPARSRFTRAQADAALADLHPDTGAPRRAMPA